MTAASQNFRTGGPTLYPTFDKESTSDKKKRIREHASYPSDLFSVYYPSSSDQKHTEYQPMKKRIQKVGQEHQNVENKSGVSLVVPITYPRFDTDGPIYSPTFYPTFDKKSISERRKHTKYQPIRKRRPKLD
mmetsp:Transcript_17322/g.37400  ORF Transcript_17322/g.37400 Transcript_17322/m.37400 type:complete len:132 (+) Transcript_17322:2025-2420(+)